MCSVLIIAACSLLFFSHVAFGQEPDRFSKAIEDNSILVEEAYNQEAGVVQHIFNAFYSATSPNDFSLAFTQEWPVVTQAHQLSYTVPAAFLENGNEGFGDVMLNYRYQLFDKSDWAAVAPRLSIIFPTGNNDKGIGFGTTGVQINFPVSKRWTEHLITHVNIGGTFLPGVEQTLPSGVQTEKTLTFANVGVSVGWLALKHLNFIVEYVTNFSNEIDEVGNHRRFNELILNPLIRGSIDVGKLQIVPALSVPVSWDQGDFQTGFIFYLSFEHPFMTLENRDHL